MRGRARRDDGDCCAVRVGQDRCGLVGATTQYYSTLVGDGDGGRTDTVGLATTSGAENNHWMEGLELDRHRPDLCQI